MDAYHLDVGEHDESNTIIHLWLTRQAAKNLFYALMMQMFQADTEEFQAVVVGWLRKEGEE